MGLEIVNEIKHFNYTQYTARLPRVGQKKKKKKSMGDPGAEKHIVDNVY